MSAQRPKSSFASELRRRKVPRSLLAYILVCWAIIPSRAKGQNRRKMSANFLWEQACVAKLVGPTLPPPEHELLH